MRGMARMGCTFAGKHAQPGRAIKHHLVTGHIAIVSLYVLLFDYRNLISGFHVYKYCHIATFWELYCKNTARSFQSEIGGKSRQEIGLK